MSNWNKRYTDLIRTTRPSLWGNWSLDPAIRPGAVGIVDPQSGSFQSVGYLDALELKEDIKSSSWKMESVGVTREEASGKASVTAVDPNTGLQITPELEVKWTMDKENSMASEFNISQHLAIKDLTALKDHYDWLYEQAEKVGMAHDGRIAQGFGVITEVIYAKSGVNLAAREEKASYTVGGSVKGMHALLGKSGPSGSASASYQYAVSDKAIDKHVWPSEAGEEQEANLSVAYAFTSFEGTQLIPTWIGKVNALVINVDSKFTKGTTYTARAELAYDTAEGRHEESATIIGGSSKIFADIPLNATNLHLRIVFIGVFTNDNHDFKWAAPLSQWLTGVRNVDISGTWPGATTVEVLEEPTR